MFDLIHEQEIKKLQAEVTKLDYRLKVVEKWIQEREGVPMELERVTDWLPGEEISDGQE